MVRAQTGSGSAQRSCGVDTTASKVQLLEQNAPSLGSSPRACSDHRGRGRWWDAHSGFTTDEAKAVVKGTTGGATAA